MSGNQNKNRVAVTGAQVLEVLRWLYTTCSYISITSRASSALEFEHYWHVFCLLFLLLLSVMPCEALPPFVAQAPYGLPGNDIPQIGVGKRSSVNGEREHLCPSRMS